MQRQASALKDTQDFCLSLSNFCNAVSKTCHACQQVPWKSEKYNLFLQLSLNDIRFSDGDEGQERERERCMSSKWLKPPECGGGACVRVCCRHSRGRGGLKKQRIRLHHSCQRYGGEKQGEWGPRQGCREKRAGREKRELGGGDTVHVILKGSGGNKAIKLRLIGKEKESTESIGNWEKEMEWKRDVGNRIQSSAEEKRGSDKEPMWSENVKKNRERMWVSQYNHTYSNNLIITRVKQLL